MFNCKYWCYLILSGIQHRFNWRKKLGGKLLDYGLFVFTEEVNPGFAKPPLKFNGSLAKLRLISQVKLVTDPSWREEGSGLRMTMDDDDDDDDVFDNCLVQLGVMQLLVLFAILSSWNVVEHTHKYTHIWFITNSLFDISSAVVIHSVWQLQYINAVCSRVISYRFRRLRAPDSLGHAFPLPGTETGHLSKWQIWTPVYTVSVMVFHFKKECGFCDENALTVSY